MADGDYKIYVVNDEGYAANENGLWDAAWQTLNILQMTPCALTVSLTTAEHVQQLNRDYAGLDETTDVLSFGAEDQTYETEEGEPPYVGDVVIAYPVAEKQASEGGSNLDTELQTLTVHGVLHLMGYDHQTPDQQAEMWAYQSAALDAVRATNSGQ